MNPTTTQWSYLPNLTSESVTLESTPPWAKPSKGGGVPAGLSKEDFAEWCKHPKTDHVFFSLAEGLIPSARVNSTNPTRNLYGIVGDYDSDKLIQMTDDEVVELMSKSLSKKKDKVLPNYMSRTFSNKVRLIWLFEKRIPGDPDEVLTLFIDKINARLGVTSILPGFDKTGSAPQHFFEFGHSWKDFNQPPVSKDILGATWFEAGSKAVLRADTKVQIPLDVVMEEIERRFPGRVQGPLHDRKKIPLFWIDDGKQTLGASVHENGVFCFSDRAEGFHSWKQIFGDSFVRDYEERMVSSILDRFAYDGNRYWIRTSSGHWHDHPRENTIPRLKEAGFSEARVKGQTLSALEKTLITIQDQCRVEGAAPFLYEPNPVVEIGHKKYVNTSKTQAMQPPGHGLTDPDTYWPFIHTYLNTLLVPDPAIEGNPLDYLLSWMKYFWESALRHEPQAGQMVVMAGGRESGKTLFGMRILGPMMGGHEDATKYLLGISEFNRDLPHCGVWRVDDAAPPETAAAKAKYSDRLKHTVANMECPFRAMYRDNVNVRWRGRIYLTCNMNADAQGILPNLSESIMDKMMLFLAADREPGFFPPSVELEAIIERELPYFLEWLHTVYQYPEFVRPKSHRFGVKCYHHGALVKTAREMSPEQNLADLLDMWAVQRRLIDGGPGEWRGNPTKLLTELSELSLGWRVLPVNAAYTGRMLTKLRENEHWRIKGRLTGAQANIYVISTAEEA